MDDIAPVIPQMTIVEAEQVLEEFKQQLVDQSYEQLVEEGETDSKVSFEVLEALESVLYYLYSQSETHLDD